MHHLDRRRLKPWALPALLTLISGGCSKSGGDYVDRQQTASVAPSEVPGDSPYVPPSAPTPTALNECVKAEASDHLPARGSAMVRSSIPTLTGVRTDDLFGQFASHCGGCHIDAPQGGFQVTRQSFSKPELKAKFERSLTLLRENDPKQLIMPPLPLGKPYKDRPEGDPVRAFAAQLDAWLGAGRPDDVFYPAQGGSNGGPSFFLPKAIGENLTNLGNCVPSAQGFASEEQRSKQLDQLFTTANTLPERLEQTDLFTFDSKELARHGVVAFAPAYTLWADNAKKIRYVRVPRGQSIRFDPVEQTFVIPPGTRFYKTFLKKVKDKSGKESYRKMETRLIVARPDDEAKNGLERPTALFGTYAWNEDETEAVLVRDPLRNGKPFRDRLLTYYLDEQEVEALTREGKKLSDSKLPPDKLSRKYAIPGSERCLHCHMGAPGKDFVLGFLPLQLKRRPLGEGGVVEPAEGHELTQLQRLIDYGVISGMTSPDEVTQLERSQGTRRPRNKYELEAQGYMLGNCAHCHNPRGFPTWSSPELTDLLNFLPSQTGGIFEFPLDRMSPRIQRGPDQNVSMPYITPSYYDLPEAYADLAPAKTRTVHRPGIPDPDPDRAIPAVDEYQPLEAPWRSLIYRNVDTPFSYFEDNAIFPHMPRDTPGYDCRARVLLGSWMLSVPSQFKGITPKDAENVRGLWGERAELFPYWFARNDLGVFTNPNAEAISSDPQPYVETKPDAVSYLGDSVAAEARVQRFKEFGRGAFCPDPALDVVDPKVLALERLEPAPEAPFQSDAGVDYKPTNVPSRAHWFVTDLTEAASDWIPRRSDWRDVLVTQKIPLPDPTKPGDSERLKNDRKLAYLLTGVDPWKNQTHAFGTLPDAGHAFTLTSAFREFALKQQPFGLWKVDGKKDGCIDTCKLQKEPTLASFESTTKPLWMGWLSSEAAANAATTPVYSVAPGAQVFSSICANCHGPLADSRGRLADTIADLTGGDTRVANLRDGILGPTDRPGANRTRVFQIPGSSAQPDDWAVRYLMWMGLGGTLRTIPGPVLSAVGTSSVLGVRRVGVADLGKAYGANMLALPRSLCRLLVQPSWFDLSAGALSRDTLSPSLDRKERVTGSSGVSWDFVRLPEAAALFWNNGDMELWEGLCSFDNPAPVRAIMLRALEFSEGETESKKKAFLASALPKPTDFSVHALYTRGSYPVATAVGGTHGAVHAALQADNAFPWCLVRPESEAEQAELLRRYRAARNDPSAAPPYCPTDWLKHSANLFQDPEGLWVTRGAMNAGAAVFVYLDALSAGKAAPQVLFDRCESLPAPASCP